MKFLLVAASVTAMTILVRLIMSRGMGDFERRSDHER